jgi:hypothetical protein
MFSVPSIIIPISEDVVSDVSDVSRKNEKTKGGYPLSSTDKSFWSLAVYEIWDSQRIQNDLISKIEIITSQIQNYRRFQTYSRKEYVKLSEKRIVEGVCMLWSRGDYEKSWKLIPFLRKLNIEIRSFIFEARKI